MEIKHNEKTGDVKFKFSWKEIFILIIKREIHYNKDMYRLVFNYFATPIIKNLENKLYDDKK